VEELSRIDFTAFGAAFFFPLAFTSVFPPLTIPASTAAVFFAIALLMKR
jgi:hypothetical protein